MRRFATYFLIVLFIMTFFYINRSEAFTSNCLKALHKQAISDAITLTPPELNAILKEQETAMHKQVNAIHASAPTDRQPFSANYKVVTDKMKSIDMKRLDYLSRMMTNITIYPFLSYSPIKMHEYCDDTKVLNSVTVIYDGFNSKAASERFPESFQYESNQELIKFQQFYSIMVNEISDLWVSMWKEAGKDIDGLPRVETLVRGKIAEVKTPSVRTVEPKVNEGQSSAETYTDTHLSKYRKTSDFEGVPTYSSDSYGSQKSTSSPSISSNSSSNSWAECDEKAKDRGIKKEFKLKASVDAYNDFMAICTGSERPTHREPTTSSHSSPSFTPPPIVDNSPKANWDATSRSWKHCQNGICY